MGVKVGVGIGVFVGVGSGVSVDVGSGVAVGGSGVAVGREGDGSTIVSVGAPPHAGTKRMTRNSTRKINFGFIVTSFLRHYPSFGSLEIPVVMSRFGGMERAPHAPYPQIWELPRRFLESPSLSYR